MKKYNKSAYSNVRHVAVERGGMGMNSLENKIQGINFKKAFIGFFIVLFVCIILSTAYLFVFNRSQFDSVINFENISNDIAEGNSNVQDVKKDISDIATSYPDIIDILVLDENSHITYSSSDSYFANNETFDFNDVQTVSKKRGPFGKKGSNKKYFVRSITDNETGEKIVLVSTKNKMWNSIANVWSRITSISLGVFDIFGLLFYLTFKALLTLWVYVDSKRCGKNTIAWTTLTLFTNVIGFIIYVVSRGHTKLKSDLE